MPGPNMETGGAGVSTCPGGPTPSELAAGRPGEERGSQAPHWGTGGSVGPLLPPLATGNTAINLPPAFPFHPLLPGCPRSLGQRIGNPSYRVAAPIFPRAKLSAGRKEGCSGERGSS